MNNGTKIRVLIYVVALLNQANAMVGVWEFGNETVNTAYKVFSYLLTLGATAAALWYNNDFTPEAAQGTGYTRQLKAEAKGEEVVGVDVEGLDYLPEDGDEDE